MDDTAIGHHCNLLVIVFKLYCIVHGGASGLRSSKSEAPLQSIAEKIATSGSTIGADDSRLVVIHSGASLSSFSLSQKWLMGKPPGNLHNWWLRHVRTRVSQVDFPINPGRPHAMLVPRIPSRASQPPTQPATSPTLCRAISAQRRAAARRSFASCWGPSD